VAPELGGPGVHRTEVIAYGVVVVARELPRNRYMIRETTKTTRATKKMTWAMVAAVAARVPNPRTAAMMAMMKKTTAHHNMVYLAS
jgi:hypothetical protein